MDIIKLIPEDIWTMTLTEKGCYWFIMDWKVEHHELVNEIRKLIKENGVPKQFDKVVHPIIIQGDYYYWTTQSARFKNTFINRAKTSDLSDYNNVASYDDLFDHTYYIAEDKLIMNMIGELKGTVLDIGCGTGYLLDNKPIEKYHGIDPSPSMVQELIKKHPDKRSSVTITTAEELFKLGNQYDNVIALFSASYVSELSVFEKLWNYKGRMLLMFYKEDYTPVTHKQLNIIPEYKKWTKQELEKEWTQSVMEFNNYYIVSI